MECKPSEFIVNFGDYRSNQFVRLNMALIEHNGAKLKERIVRCRDCDYYEHDELEHFNYCGCWCSFDIDPFGYCSNAERMDGE